MYITECWLNLWMNGNVFNIQSCGQLNTFLGECKWHSSSNSYDELLHSGKKKVEWIKRILSHGVAAWNTFEMDQGNPFRDCIDSLLIDLEGYFLLMINKVIKRNKENTPHLKGDFDYWTNQVNTCFTFQQVLYFATLWKGILLVHSTFFTRV